jgi:1,2-diacylglycerol 3-beta-glucosyltransferase
MPFLEIILCVISLAALLPAALAALYYAGLAIVALLPERSAKITVPDPIHRFIVLIPAHNEEHQVGNALQSCFKLDYPRDKFATWVIADNCSDRTSDVASSLGANCIIRTDAIHRGKGYALAYAFEKLEQAGFGAFVILDADCEIDPGALQEFDLHLRKGEQVLQTADCVSNIDDNPISYALAVGNLIENRLFYAAKSRLRLPVMLRGTGMVLHRDILHRVPWEAHSIVEDQEYSLRLIRAGISTRFLTRIEVRSPFPTEGRQLNIQRERWTKGNSSFGKSQAFRLLFEGLRKPSLKLLDAGWMLLVLSRPLVLACLFTAVLLSIAAHWLVRTAATGILLQASAVLLAFYILYFSLGIVLLGLTKKRLLMLLRVPFVLMRLIRISLCGLAGNKNLQWTRTPRSQ